MKESTQKGNSINSNIREKKAAQQPKAAVESDPGYGDKKLDGPNRPST